MFDTFTRSGIARVPALVILYHPDMSRVGERALLTGLASGVPTEISRHFPLFATMDGRVTSHLGDRDVSRSPLTLTPDGAGGLHIEADTAQVSYCLNGQPGSGDEHISADQMARGMLITLGDRVLLLLDQLEPRRRQQAGHGMIGISDAIERTRGEISQVAGLSVPVLIRGETGSGKERVARAIHAASTRAHRPFVSVNMAAIAPATAASELFGHRRGAFTDAVTHHAGFFGAADGGTLFLDEVGETPMAVQTLLLRALDEGQVQPVGGPTRTVDVRLIAATDADLETEVSDGRFRDALLHRIQVCTIDVPPLRRRREEIPSLFLHFLREQLRVFGAEHLLDPRPDQEPWLQIGVVMELVANDWPGNVRQLRNIATEMVIRGVNAPAASIPPTLYRTRRRDRRRVPSGDYAAHPIAHTALTDREVDVRTPPSLIPEARIVAVLRSNEWNITAAARELGMAKNTLIARMKTIEGVRLSSDLSVHDIARAQQQGGGNLEVMATLLQVSPRALAHRLRELQRSPASSEQEHSR
jgi:two-component system nitrogen regulation response regulator GlnG